MGGLALGAAVAARFVRRLTRPVLAYGVLELGIAIGAMCVPFLIRGLQAAYFSIAGSLDAPPETMALTTALFHLAGSFVVVETREGWRLRTNGLPEAGLYRVGMPDLRNKETSWLSLLPAAARPEAKQILIIGLGSGQTLDAVPSTVSSIDVIELEEDVVIANRLIPRPHNPLDDPRVSLRIGDARGAMNLSNKRYDAIISQPSHPWTAGASHLYTREFSELTRSKLGIGATSNCRCTGRFWSVGDP